MLSSVIGGCRVTADDSRAAGTFLRNEPLQKPRCRLVPLCREGYILQRHRSPVECRRRRNGVRVLKCSAQLRDRFPVVLKGTILDCSAILKEDPVGRMPPARGHSSEFKRAFRLFSFDYIIRADSKKEKGAVQYPK